MTLTLLKIGIRNLLRQRKRTLLVGICISIGSFSFICGLAYIKGLETQMIEGVTAVLTGDLQLHSSKSQVDPLWQDEFHIFKLNRDIKTKLNSIEQVECYTERLRNSVYIYSPDEAMPALCIGIVPSKDLIMHFIKGASIEHISDIEESEILLNPHFARELNVKKGDVITLLATSPEGMKNALDFTIKDTVEFRNLSSMFLKHQVFINLEDMQKLLMVDSDIVSEVIIHLHDRKYIHKVSQRLNNDVGIYDLCSSPWTEVGKLFKGIINSNKIVNTISSIVVFFIIGIFILNIVTISVIERVREFGTMMTIGMKKTLLVKLVIMEAASLGFFFSGIGVTAGTIVILILQSTGILAISDAMKIAFGGERLYPILTLFQIFFSWFIPVFVSIIATFSSVLRIVKLRPVEAISYI